MTTPQPNPDLLGDLSLPADLNPPLLTARLRLEPQVTGHAEAMMKVLADPRTHTYIPSDPPTDLNALRARQARLESRQSPDGIESWLNWTVFAGLDAIGTVQASVRHAEGSADVAYIFAPAVWGQGYATEAMRAVLSFLPTLRVARAQASIDTRNLASQKLVTRLGFVQMGEILAADEFKGEISDEYVYELQLIG